MSLGCFLVGGLTEWAVPVSATATERAVFPAASERVIGRRLGLVGARVLRVELFRLSRGGVGCCRGCFGGLHAFGLGDEHVSHCDR